MNLSIKELNELIYSLGITAHNGNFCNREVNESLLERLYCELNERIAEEAIDEEVESDTYYVSNEEADEDFRISMMQDEQRYEKSRVNKGVTQAILDMVQRQGDATHTEMHNFYKRTFGSNSFSHILRSLIVPYKNRTTRRYLSKMANGNYEVKVAQLHNWVVNEY